MLRAQRRTARPAMRSPSLCAGCHHCHAAPAVLPPKGHWPRRRNDRSAPATTPATAPRAPGRRPQGVANHDLCTGAVGHRPLANHQAGYPQAAAECDTAGRSGAGSRQGHALQRAVRGAWRAVRTGWRAAGAETAASPPTLRSAPVRVSCSSVHPSLRPWSLGVLSPVTSRYHN
ncbi:hypothetical protein D3C79_881500 [compost metagenome]